MALEQRFARPSVMGIVNVTPDSFSDGGVNFRPEDAVDSARRMVAEGAAIVDVGGESTRPGSEAVSLDEELRRVVPVLESLTGLPVSIDTAKADVARRALELGAEMVNDVTALRADPELAEVAAEADAYVCLMHMQGEPRTMQASPTYDDVVSDVRRFLEERVQLAVDSGIREDRICIDPGIGFGKTVEQNFELIRRLDEIVGARPARRRRLLAEELARQDPRRPRRDHRSALGQHRGGRDRLRARCDHPSRARRERARGGADRGPGGGRVIVELVGLEVFGRHGVDDDERETGRTFLYDITLSRRRASGGPAGSDRGLSRRRGLRARGVGRGRIPADREAGRSGGGRARRPVRCEPRGGPGAQAGDRACRPDRRVLGRYRSARELICSAYRLERTPLAGKTSRYA